jgi:hypothetical protein
MDVYIGNSIFDDRSIFSGYNLSIPGATAQEIFELVRDHPPIWQCFDNIMLSSMGNDALRSLDPVLAEEYLRKTIDVLLDSGAKKVILLELPLLEQNIISTKHDDPRYLRVSQDYDQVILAADIYREQLTINPASDGVHLNRQGSLNLHDRLQDVADRGPVYHQVIKATSNHLGADILERSGITPEFAQHLIENCDNWICAYERTICAGYVEIIGIVSSYDSHTLYENFINI